jgi:hypothetical protein
VSEAAGGVPEAAREPSPVYPAGRVGTPADPNTRGEFCLSVVSRLGGPLTGGFVYPYGRRGGREGGKTRLIGTSVVHARAVSCP